MSDAIKKIKGYLGSIEHNAVYAENLTTKRYEMYEKTVINELLEWLGQLQAKVERYEKALKFYADEENYKEKLISKAEYDVDGNWVEPAHYEPPIIYFDKGQIARQVLEGDEN